ncbi:hypothetical protein KSS87_011542, partial [Heliosperma pusillum]
WQKKMHFLLTALKVVYVLSTPMPEIMGDETLAEIQRKRNKWENDDYICRGHILNGMSDSLFDIYQNFESARDLWNQLGSKYMDEDASSKKFLDEESLRAQDGGKGKGKGKDVIGSSSVNMMEKGEGSKNTFKGKKRPYNTNDDEYDKTPKGACWTCGKTEHFKINCKVGKHKKRKGSSTYQGGQWSKDQGPPTNKGRKVYQIPEPYILTRWTKKSYRPIVYDENGKVIEDFDEVDVRKIEMSNVWSEIYKTVGLLDSGELKNMKEFSKLLKQFRETVVGAVEKKSKNKEIEDLLGCKAPQEIDILPPHKAKNKGSGKRQMSSKEKAVRKTEKRKRRCGNCKRWVNHNSRTCNLPFVEDLPSDDNERETDDEEEESSDA